MTTWNDDEVRMLIDERKADNEHYHSLSGGRKRAWWMSTAGKINQRFRTNFAGQQVAEKFQGLVRDCRVSIQYYII
jgi:hypothetical protein